ncbi:MAG: hypothetical protein JW704_06840 [Anaerolineaceae bacterium]|nr:hypothetical protein [Anaerolineaceae bacterium]MBN2676564.1 hypothetical protein [Anaerolineaceae bacterium]
MRKTISIILVLALVLIPTSVFAQAGKSYTSGFQVQNLENSDAHITIDFYSTSGTVAATASYTIGALATQVFYPLSDVAAGFSGSVVISSDKKLASVVNILTADFAGSSSYTGLSEGDDTINLPLIMAKAYNISTWFSLQNLGVSDATVLVTYKGMGTSCTESATISPGASAVFDQSTNTCLDDIANWVGAATVTTASGNALGAIVMQATTTTNQTLAYNGFFKSSQKLAFANVSSNFYRSGTGMQVQNIGASSTNVTLTFSPSAGFPGNTCTQTLAIPAGESRTFGWPQFPSGCGSTSGFAGITDTVNGAFVGSAVVTGNSASMPLVGIANIVTRASTGTLLTAGGSTYNAVLDGDSSLTSTVALPIIADRNYGIFSGLAILNMSAEDVDITCTFTGTSYTVSQNDVAPGASVTASQFYAIAPSYVGSGTCTAVASDGSGTALIAGMVNQLSSTAPVTNDGLTTYDSINY